MFVKILVTIVIVVLFAILLVFAFKYANFVYIMKDIWYCLIFPFWKSILKRELRIHCIENGKKWSKKDFKIINEYCKEAKLKNCRLQFRKGRNLNPNGLNANAGLKYKWSPIVATPQWALQLVFNKTIGTQNAFNITLGHELGHKVKEVPVIRNGIKYGIKYAYNYIKSNGLKNNFQYAFQKSVDYGRKYANLMAQTNEVHHDFYGTLTMAERKQENLLNSISYKLKFKQDRGETDFTDDSSHPSWELREKYANMLNFDKELIKEIATDLGFDINEQAVQIVIDDLYTFYGEIELISKTKDAH